MNRNRLCLSCRLTRIIPELSQPGNKEAWYRLEVAKRRLVYSLLDLALPLKSKAEDPEHGLAFEFLASSDVPDASPVLTGHDKGVITINVAEADDAEREKRRLRLHEPYRTVLGHFRHEIGHYYWDRLIQHSDRLDEFRDLFGDERARLRSRIAAALRDRSAAGLAAALRQRLRQRPPVGGLGRDLGALPAHDGHAGNRRCMRTVVAPRRDDEPSLDASMHGGGPGSFDRMIGDWFPLTYVLNNLNRGLGLADGYPFVLSPPAIDKLRFVHETIERR